MSSYCTILGCRNQRQVLPFLEPLEQLDQVNIGEAQVSIMENPHLFWTQNYIETTLMLNQ